MAKDLRPYRGAVEDGVRRPGLRGISSTPPFPVRRAVLYVSVIALLSSVLAGAGIAVGPSASVPHPVGSAAATPTDRAAPVSSLPSTPAVPNSPHPGTLDVYEIAPAGATTEDPAVAYDSVSEEPILNVYETLVSYNGNSTAAFVPTLATCVPGTTPCTADYGSNLTAEPSASGTPVAWTFVIDPAARFFDPGAGASWPVFPSDVVFSIARTLAFADLPYSGLSPGWILAQALLPNGNARWDSGIHFPYNNTPQRILDSMRVNDTAYCPADAMNGITGNGCVTFVANGSGTVWPFFLDLLADGLGASIVPCGWFTYEGAGIPGWAGTSATRGDGSCLLPDGGTTTNSTAWTSYLGDLSPTAWDAFEELALSPGWPAPQPNVQWTMVGSGPYAATITPGTGYQLSRNPAYEQPSGCSGAHGLLAYGGGCDPTPGSFEATVNVHWEPDDSVGIGQLEAGQADFAGFEFPHIVTLLGLESEGKINLLQFPTLVEFFTPINLNVDLSAYNSEYPSAPPQNIPSTFFDNLAVRNFYVDAYPYATVQTSIETIDHVPLSLPAGGPIPNGMGNYYPANVTFPFELNGGQPDTNPSDVGGAAWWWAQALNGSSPYYDPQLSACSVSVPCTWAIAGLLGDPAGDLEIADWIASIESLSGGVLKPFGGADLACPPIDGGCLCIDFCAESGNPLVSWAGTGWAPDYADPTDYLNPLAAPDSTYTAPDSFSQELEMSAFNSGSCGHSNATFANLTYWAHGAANYTIGTACQGVAYNVSVAFMAVAAAAPIGPQRTLEYNEIEFVLNGLAMYVYNGQSNALFADAPWIDDSSVNGNPLVGGAGDQLWYQVHYATFESAVTFKEHGLLPGQEWSVSAGAPAETHGNTTTTHGGSVVFEEPNGSLVFSVTPPAGYGVAKITGPAHPSYTSAAVPGQPVTYTVVFGANESVTFAEQSGPAWPGLPPGTPWTVALTAPASGDMPGQSATTNGSSVTFTLPHGANFRFQVVKPTIYRASGGHGSLAVPDHALSKTVRFAEFTSTVTFTARGLPAHTGWSVVLSGAVNTTLSGTAAALAFHAVNGTYNYTIAAVGSRAPVPANGTFTVTAPTAVHLRIAFTDPPGPASPAAGPSSLASAATPSLAATAPPGRARR